MEKKYLKNISWLQHLLAWAVLVGLVIIYLTVDSWGIQVKIKEFIKDLTPDLIAANIALIIAYYFLIKLETDSEESIEESLAKGVNELNKTLNEKYEAISNKEENVIFKLTKLSEDFNTKLETIQNAEVSLSNALTQLSDTVTTVTWASDIEKHDTNVFNKMADLLDDSEVTGMDVLSIYHQGESPSGEGAEAAGKYFNKIENAIISRKIRYRRVVVIRRPIGEQSTRENIFSIVSERLTFSNHCNTVKKQPRENADIRFVCSEGRILDVAFALFYVGNVQMKRIKTLVIEITVWSSEKGNHVMGLLAIDRPSSELISAFSDAFNGVFENRITDLDFNTLDEVFGQ